MDFDIFLIPCGLPPKPASDLDKIEAKPAKNPYGLSKIDRILGYPPKTRKELSEIDVKPAKNPYGLSQIFDLPQITRKIPAEYPHGTLLFLTKDNNPPKPRAFPARNPRDPPKPRQTR